MNKKSKLYYVDTEFGCAIRAASDIDEARRAALREVGSNGYKSVRPAKTEDIEWVKAMGGYVPNI